MTDLECIHDVAGEIWKQFIWRNVQCPKYITRHSFAVWWCDAPQVRGWFADD